jgi:radical SAM protein with 4Fe4S-binding SPASM domain
LSRRDVAAGRYAELANRWRSQAAACRRPIIGTVELTPVCNLRCRHCYVAYASESSKNDTARQLGVNEWAELFDQAATAGCLWLGISGGEPLCHPDFLEIYRAARKRGFLITILTNGTLITERVVSELADLPPLSVEVSMYGASAATYHRVTGSSSGYKNCLRGIERLVDNGLHVVLKSTLTRDNAEDLEEIRAVGDRFGLEFRFDGVLNSRLDGHPVDSDLPLGPEELVRLELASDGVAEAWSVRAEHHLQTAPSRATLLDCGAARNAFHIDWSGRLMPCVMLREPAVDLTSTTFAEGWEGPLAEISEQPWSEQAECRGCSLAAFCNTCAGFGRLDGGDPEAAVDSLCRLAEARLGYLNGRSTTSRCPS